MISTMQLMMIKEAVSTTALEKGWDKEKEQEMFDQAIAFIIEKKS